MNYREVNSLLDAAAAIDGVLTMSDIRILFNQFSNSAIFKKLAKLVADGVLIKVKAGVYALPAVSLEAISQRMEPQSYISTGTILAKALVIGSIPARRLQAVKVGRPRTYVCKLGTIEYLSIKEELFFGYDFRLGIKEASPEKAFLDTCYYYFKGRKFSFDLFEDVNLDRLNMDVIQEALERYDRRFINFFNTNWGMQ